MVGIYNITILQGADTNDLEITPTEDDGTPIDLSTSTAGMQIRPTAKSSIIYDSLTTINARLVIESYVDDAVTYWRVVIKFPSATTSTYDWTDAVYDLELYTGSVTERLIEGTVTVSPEVTR